MIYDPTSFNPSVDRQLDAAFAKIRALEKVAEGGVLPVDLVGSADFGAARSFSVDLRRFFTPGVSGVRYLAINSVDWVDTSNFTDSPQSTLYFKWETKEGDSGTVPELVERASGADYPPTRGEFFEESHSSLYRLTYVAGVVPDGIVVIEFLHDMVT